MPENPNQPEGEQHKPYELEPIPVEPSPQPPAVPAPAPAVPQAGKLSDKGLIDDMPEDADFDHDPEVERALKGDRGEASKDGTVDEDPKPVPPFVRAGGDPKTLALV